MKETDDVGDHIVQIQLIAKELYDDGHPITDKMQVTTIINSFPPFWHHFITSLIHRRNNVTMSCLLLFLVLEGKRKKRRKRESE